MFHRSKTRFAVITEPYLIRLETHLERHGKWRLAQRLRRKQHKWRPPAPEDWTQVHQYIESKQTVLFVIQIQTWTQQALHRCYLELTDGSPVSDEDGLVSTMQALQEALPTAGEGVWYAERECHNKALRVPDGPLQRALRTHERQAMSHLREWQRNECAAMGGCCGRGCGCCSKPRNPDASRRHYGHCFAYCVCCCDERGFDLRAQTIADDPTRVVFDLTKGPKNDYHRHLLDAYFWGLER
ncbi:uncharacterized protein BP01DRAFT_299273 [Aspergillus saccharolyticus JOP 1030-1]|uniref:Uncharacterized protein n=1 Tax=Aspergillus saccharolyticus JOP 1030-1 TaxID=1450539 RepID=A0A318Z9K0_9EURO|nr:hypothetical protein BP01DRAFT_299273 [Aspergillus saccharolyticus JOP 1030-1]PYH44081.1 hypothetical protein BP01DRAFT_299273 [Aspergillus saccharolyticus JOP 1030-1]